MPSPQTPLTIGSVNGCIRDPRGQDPSKRMSERSKEDGRKFQFIDSFEPNSTLVPRPDLRLQVGFARDTTYSRPLSHDDVILVPEMFGREDDWSVFDQLL